MAFTHGLFSSLPETLAYGQSNFIPLKMK